MILLKCHEITVFIRPNLRQPFHGTQTEFANNEFLLASLLEELFVYVRE